MHRLNMSIYLLVRGQRFVIVEHAGIHVCLQTERTLDEF